MSFVVAFVLLVGICLWCARASHRVARMVLARHPVGADGLIPGAASIALPVAHGQHAVLLLHGFGDTPQSLAYLANDLHAHGYAVAAPLLPGHGRTLRAFAASSAEEWLVDARSALTTLRARHAHVGVVGLSMGGALAALLAADDPGVSALVLLAPYLRARPLVRSLARVHRVAGLIAPYVASGDDARSIHDPVERARALSYGAATPRLVAELVTLADRARHALPRITVPTLLVQSRDDNRLTAATAEHAIALLGAREKRLEWVRGCGHVLTVDYGRAQVSAMVAEWLDRWLHAPSSADAPRSHPMRA
ncbi:MAG TPA: alpha/beta fold hydrolase [Gemmatimonadaceae bacterium]